MQVDRMSGKDFRVDFLVIGAARSGTTSVCKILEGQDEICFSKPKEPQFFSDPNWRDKLYEYHELFADKGKICGEGSTNYSKYPSFNKHIHADIFEYNPNIKLIYIIRNPFERLISHYKFSVERGLCTKPIEEEIRSNPIYVDSGKYYSQIKPYVELFGTAKILILVLEELRSNPKSEFQKIFEFLNLDHPKLPEDFIHLNASGKGIIADKKFDDPKGLFQKFGKLFHFLKRKSGLIKRNYEIELSKAKLEQLRSIYATEIREMEKLFNLDLRHWL